MHILMCNDDGILADGLRHLASYLSQYYRITVVAPANEQSAKSHALTTEVPLKLDAYNGEDENPRHCKHLISMEPRSSMHGI